MQGLPSIGSIIDGTYEIKSLLGKGGFGAVFLARHIPMEREVALKLLIAQGPNPQEMILRFRREVMAIRNLSHPNTVRIFDYRDSPDDALIYYTMEYLRGETLKEVVRREGPQSPRRIKNILKQILKSLAEAHSLGIVHRDLKPANIMLVQMYGEEDFVKVLDFGIAKLLEQEDDEEDPLTSAGMLVGTLRYMSPEQIKGEPLGPYTDIYALGLIAMEMLIGESVFAGTGRWEILQKQVSPTPIEFPEALLHTPLRPVFERMLAKNPAQRYPSAEQLLRDLNAIPDHALSASPLIVSHELGAAPTSPSGTSSASHIERSAPITPQPINLDQVPTTISRIEDLRQPVMAPQQAALLNSPTLPLPSVPSASPSGFTPQPALQPAPHLAPLPASDTAPSFSLSQSGAFPAPPPANTGISKPLVGGVALLVLCLIAGGVYLASASLDDAPDTLPPPVERDALATTTPPPSIEPVVEPVVEREDPEPSEQDPPVVVAPEPHMILLTLAKKSTSAKAHAYLGEEDLGTLPLDYALEGDDPLTVTIKAEGYASQEVELSPESPEKLEITLAPEEKKREKTRKSERKEKPGKKESEPDWVQINKVKKKPAVPDFNTL